MLAIGGIVATGLLAPWLAGVAQRRTDRLRFEQDRAGARRDDVRLLLDRSAELLAPGATNLREIGHAGGAVPTEMNSWMKDTFIMGQRLRLHLNADHEVVRAYDAVLDAMSEVAAREVGGHGYDDAVGHFEDARGVFLECGRRALAAPVSAKDDP